MEKMNTKDSTLGLVILSKMPSIRFGIFLASKGVMLLSCFLLALPCSAQRGVFLTQQDFLAQAFTSPPETKTYWFTPETRRSAEAIIQRSLPLRVRYFQSGTRSAWILEEIGKELPITMGFVIEQNQIKLVRVLEYREIRGGEVRYDFFTQQFVDTQLNTEDQTLNKSIDGISGATLSVRAMTKTARLALFLAQQTSAATPSK